MQIRANSTFKHQPDKKHKSVDDKAQFEITAPLRPLNFELDMVTIQKIKTKGPDSRYQIRYYFNQKRWYVCSDKGIVLSTEKSARKLAAVIDHEIAQNSHNPLTYQSTSSKQLLFKTQIQKWLLEKQRDCKPTTSKTYETFIRLYINPFFGEYDLPEIKAFHISDFLNSLPSSLSPNSKNHILNVVKMFFCHCSKEDIIHKSPKMPSIKIPERSVRWADYETQNKLLDLIPPEDKAIFHFSMRQGLRICEVLGLMKKDVNFQTKSISIERGLLSYGLSSTKTGKNRFIPIHPELTDTLQNLCSLALPDAFLFTKNGKPYNKDQFYRIAQKAAKKLGLKISAYELVRHSVLSQAGVRLVDARTIQAFAGHSRLSTTQKYTALNALPLANVLSLNPISQLPIAPKKNISGIE